MLIFFSINAVESLYVLKRQRPLYVHFYIRLKDISVQEQQFLLKEFTFYANLSQRYKRFFRHRLAVFMEDKVFVSREGQEITSQVKLLISATAIMLTFGMRNYTLDILERIIVYPSSFFSRTNKHQHLGEFNRAFKSLALSWEGVQRGFENEHDNLNLAIHEFTHVLHFNSRKFKDVSSTIFSDGYDQLEKYLSNKKNLAKLKGSTHFRTYMYTNQFEFLAVLIEHFIESPVYLKQNFPELYTLSKRMLNFRFAGY
ncbi:zinc-dependent peptidase [Gangjinia marincola]|uniref:Zinc-dependent peptidase n=2 Tax=Gangjinia marincola TaxID=578463 RepID=A0ABP3XXX5_9FLAO